MHTEFVQKEIWTIPYKTLYIIWSLRNDPLALSYETQVSKLGIRTDLSPTLREQQKLRQKHNKIYNF